LAIEVVRAVEVRRRAHGAEDSRWTRASQGGEPSPDECLPARVAFRGVSAVVLPRSSAKGETIGSDSAGRGPRRQRKAAVRIGISTDSRRRAKRFASAWFAM